MVEDKRFAPCGVDCGGCKEYTNSCKGCVGVEGKPSWVSYIGKETCPLYDCPINEKKYKSCGDCINLPCEKFLNLRDPSMSDEEFENGIKARLEILKNIKTE